MKVGVVGFGSRIAYIYHEFIQPASGRSLGKKNLRSCDEKWCGNQTF